MTTPTTGTCPCCFGSFVVKRDLMVLHGYKRPGHGYIVGNCPATRHFRPYEVSVEGTKYMLGLAETVLMTRKAYLKALTTGKIVEFTVEQKKKGYYNLSSFQIRRMPHDQLFDTIIVRKGDGQKSESYRSQEWYEEVLQSRISETEGEIRHIKGDIAFLQEKIAAWKPVDLAAQNKAAVQEEAEEQAGLCPGSNTHNHDSKGVRFYMKWAVCNVCKTRVSLTSAFNLRKHPKQEA